MASIFDQNDLTDEQRARYEWAVAEYARIQEQNRLHGRVGNQMSPHRIGPKSALFARLLEGKSALPYPPPTSFSYPWYDIIEKPGPHHVSIGSRSSAAGVTAWNDCAGNDEHLILNQCAWRIVRKNDGGTEFLNFLRQISAHINHADQAYRDLHPILALKPEYIVTYGKWGEFRLSLGRIVRRGRRTIAMNSRFDLATLDGGNPCIVRVLVPGTEMRAKADATLNALQDKHDQLDADLTTFDRILLVSESTIRRSEHPEDDDLVEFDCDGWVLEKI